MKRAAVAVSGAALSAVSFAFYSPVAGWAAVVATAGAVILAHKTEWGSADGWVYLLQCPSLRVYKIGWSGDRLSPTRRTGQIISEAPVPVRLVCYGRGNRLLEQSLHDRFRAQWAETTLPAPTEWFRLSTDQAAEVAALLTERN